MQHDVQKLLVSDLILVVLVLKASVPAFQEGSRCRAAAPAAIILVYKKSRGSHQLSGILSLIFGLGWIPKFQCGHTLNIINA